MLGRGDTVYEHAADLLTAWRMHESSRWSEIRTAGEVHSALITMAALPHPSLPVLWAANPCRVVWVRRGRSEAVVIYSTLEQHLLAGEERMSVRKDTAGDVRFEVLSVSRGAGLLGRLVFPLLARTQQRFFDEQCKCMKELVLSTR